MSLFTPYFKDSISVQNYIGVNDFGDTQYSSATDMLCRVEYKTQETLDSKGNKVISTATIYARFLIYRPLWCRAQRTTKRTRRRLKQL